MFNLIEKQFKYYTSHFNFRLNVNYIETIMKIIMALYRKENKTPYLL